MGHEASQKKKIYMKLTYTGKKVPMKGYQEEKDIPLNTSFQGIFMFCKAGGKRDQGLHR